MHKPRVVKMGGSAEPTLITTDPRFIILFINRVRGKAGHTQKTRTLDPSLQRYIIRSRMGQRVRSTNNNTKNCEG